MVATESTPLHAQAYFVSLGVACAMALLLLAPMANLKSFVQRSKSGKAALKAA